MSTLSTKPNQNGNLFEIKTVQSGAFRTLIEALKEFLRRRNLEFDSNGIKVISVDETHTVLVTSASMRTASRSLYRPAKHVLGVNMIYLSSLSRPWEIMIT
jgi:hypothetical protein